jgi:hypothetical protein
MLATGVGAPITQFGTAWGRPRQAGKMRQNGGYVRASAMDSSHT